MKRIVQAGFISVMLGAGAALAAAPTSPNSAQIDASGPSQLIETAANSLLAGIDQNRAEYRKNPSALYKLVGDTLLPNFDTAYAAERVLGVHWRSATPEQRERFVNAFYHSLLYTYGDAMVNFTADRFRVIHTKVPPNADTAVVRTKIKRANGQVIDVNFQMRKVGDAWKAYNMAFEGVNYIVTYRQEFGAEVNQKGLDAVIVRLEAKAEAAKAANGRSS